MAGSEAGGRGRGNIIRYCSRPFSDASHVDAIILRGLNERLKADDHLYILGDFCRGGAEKVKGYRQRIVRRNLYLVRGNHDKDTESCSDVFRMIESLAEVRLDGRRVLRAARNAARP